MDDGACEGGAVADDGTCAGDDAASVLSLDTGLVVRDGEMSVDRSADWERVRIPVPVMEVAGFNNRVESLVPLSTPAPEGCCFFDDEPGVPPESNPS